MTVCTDKRLPRLVNNLSSHKFVATWMFSVSWAKKDKRLNWASKLQKNLAFVFIWDPKSHSLINQHLNSRSPFHREPWVFRFWFYFWFVFHYFLKLLMFQRQWGKWGSPGRVSGFEFWNSAIQKFTLLFTETVAGSLWPLEHLVQGLELGFCVCSLQQPFTPSTLFFFPFFFPLHQHVVACDTS